MPKPPPEDYFEITYRCSKDQLGEEVAGLIRRGHDEVKYNLVTDVRAYAQRAKSGVNTAEFVAKWVEDHPTFKAIECVTALKEATGAGGTAVYPALSKLVEKGILKKLGEGNYAHAAVKHLAPPKGKQDKAYQRFEVSHTDFILRIGRRNHGRFAASKVKDAFEKDGRKRASVSTAINTLLQHKQIKRVGEGEYVLKAAKPKSKPTANGEPTTEQPMTEASNG
jgi:predicted transcriptional regulator of viral defense system